MAKHYFHYGDFIVFGATIVTSLAIGIYYAFSGGRQKTTSEYLLGGKAMSFIPVAISLLVSFESSVMMLGFPAESYVYGMQFMMSRLGYMMAQLLSVNVVVPLLHPLNITSAYEYLELRFRSRWVRLVGTLMGMLTEIWYMGVVLYGPAVALEAVTGFPQWSSIFIIELVAVIYTAFGGLKAVIWTDVFQAIVMFSGIFSILVKGTIYSGGPRAVWDIAQAGGRLNFFNFDPDPRTRHTFWSLSVSGMIRGFGMLFSQSTVQRISSTKSERDAKRMLWSVVPSFSITLLLAAYQGVVAYSYYVTKKCDPFESKQITNPNQILPFIVMDIFQGLPGMPGLFLASLFSASLSSLSSALSSLSALLWTDVIHPLVGPNVSELKATIFAKISVLVFGGMACGVAMVVSQVGGTLTQMTGANSLVLFSSFSVYVVIFPISGSIVQAFGGPVTGIFFTGCFCPTVNAKGAITGGLVGLIFASWLSIGMNFSPVITKTPWLPGASTANCTADVATNSSVAWLSSSLADFTGVYTNNTASPILSTVAMSMTIPDREPEGIEIMYTISYLWISVLSTFVCVVVAKIVSVLTGANKPGDVDPRYLISFSVGVLFFLPGPVKRYLSSLGPQFMKEEYKVRFPDPTRRFESLDTELEIKTLIT